jgi:GxxExxY protein
MSVFYYRKESDLIGQCAHRVQRLLGNCLTKELYMDALEIEFAGAGLKALRDAPLPVWYGDEGAGRVRLPHDYRTDFLVNGNILVLVKAEGDTGCLNDYALMALLYAADLHLAILVQFKAKNVQINRLCRYNRYSNSLNFHREDWLKVGDGEGPEHTAEALPARGSAYR